MAGGVRHVPDTFFVDGMVTGSVTASVNSTRVVPENPFRKNFCICNDTPDPIFLRFINTPASSNAYHIRIPSYQLYELMKPPITGAIYLAFGGVSGSAPWIEVS